MSKTKQITTPEEAAQILMSACQYCLQAGLTVKMLPAQAGTLELSISGIEFTQIGGRPLFVPTVPPQPTGNVPTVPPQVPPQNAGA